MKKLLKVMSVFSLCLVGTTPIQAQEEYISETDEITIEEMFKQAKEAAQYNLASQEDENLIEFDATLVSEDGEIGEVEIYKYEPYSIHTDEEIGETYVLAASILSDKKDISPVPRDQYGIVYAYITIFYSYKTTSPMQCLLTTVRGSWSFSDSSITLRNRQVLMSCQGSKYSGGFEGTQRTVYYPSVNSFSAAPGYSTYVLNDGVLGALGASSYVEISDQYGNKWSLEATCDLFNHSNLLSISGR